MSADHPRDGEVKRRSLISRIGFCAIAALGLGALVGKPTGGIRPLIVYNASASVPTGYYRIAAAQPIRRGDLVLVRTPNSVRKLADQRGYLPATVPMLKHVAALHGDIVCARDVQVWINTKAATIRQHADSLGRGLPLWTGCHRLANDEVFLLNANAPNSFDGRYFGVSKSADVIGRAAPL